ncbi:TonB-dependent siderophore receptor [Microbulbifer sp. GL-2]|uniref:TonB-dependent receptor plug domain-containing protein n=1 Tax=Microbulbifer sp. GL-2 TaxID=2591606 RepID=UPI001163CEB2|nr:TonB-dependent receptor [Microbulbifer sp. GL-2]BBM00512.1 TonB-dependent receptor [Microbulbifer sp. GL-2]
MGTLLKVKYWAFFSLILLLPATGTADSSCPKPSISLPAGSLPQALISLGQQCKVSVLVQTSSASRYALPAQDIPSDDGQFELALQQLLQDLPFTYQRISSNSFAVTPDSGQPPEPLDTIKPPTEEVTVTGQSLTGSHLRHYQLDSYAPIDRLSREQLELTGAQTIAGLLKFLPAISGNSTSTSVSQEDNGTATVSLRGLPASNTLVLINGRRIIGDGYNGEATDLNTIPLSLVERVEILKDGASAIYGSDAIAGVINIILRRDFEGLSIDSYYGQAQENDLQTESHHLAWGRQGERSHLMLSLAHYKQGAVMSRDRSLSKSADSRNDGGTDKRSSAIPEGFIALDSRQVVTSASSGIYQDWSQEERYDYNDYTSAISPIQSSSGYFSASYELDENTLLFTEVMGLHTSAEATNAPTPVFTRFDNGELTIAADNIYNPFDQDITDVRKRIIEMGPRVQTNQSTTWRLNSGIKGTYNEWQWELGTAFHHTDKTEKLSNLIDPFALSLSLKGPDICNANSGCVPVNLFGPSGSIDSAQLDFIRGQSSTRNHSRMESLTFVSDGILGQIEAGEILAAAGFEVRHEALSSNSNDSKGLSFIGGYTPGSAKGSRTIKEAFAEVSVPIKENKLWLDGAVRFSNYSDFGSTHNPKLAIRWNPTDTLQLRAAYATGFRAPTLTDMYQQGYQSQEFILDPCASDNADNLTGCPGQAGSARIQYLTEFGGNPDLNPEISKTLSASLRWTPAQIEGLSVAIELFDIKQDDVIGSSPQFLVDQNAYMGIFPEKVIRDDKGEIIKILATRTNKGSRDIRGYDIALRYDLEPGDLGQLSLAVNMSHMLQYLNQGAQGLPEEDLAGTFVDTATGGVGSLPDWKANAGAYWSNGNWKLGYTVHFVGGMEESYIQSDSLVTRKIDSWVSQDLQLALSKTSNARFTIGVNNLLNSPPPSWQPPQTITTTIVRTI